MAECEDPPPAEVPGRGLVRFADLTEDIDARVEALNSALVPTEVRLTYVEGLDDELRQLAMRVATDVAALDHWALTGSPTERQIVASNRWTAPGTLCHLTGDRTQRCGPRSPPTPAPASTRWRRYWTTTRLTS